MVDLTSLVPELCSAEYSAMQIQVPDGPRQVWLLAQGEHPTAGYHVDFTATPSDVFPPEFALWHVRPTGIVLQQVTAFYKFRIFNAENTITSVMVHDAAGSHKVKVEQLAEGSWGKKTFLGSVMTLLRDGPFPR